MVTQSVCDIGNRPKVMVLVDWYSPAYKSGGPVRTIEGIVYHLCDNFDFQILTRDRDIGDLVPFKDVAIDEWQHVGKADVFYASPQQIVPHALRRVLNMSNYDLLYLNSFFSPWFTIFPLALQRFGFIKRRPVILAPRGEFSPGAIRLKYAKKRCFLWIAKLLKLYEGVFWHASSEFEKENIQKWLHLVTRTETEEDKVKIASNIRIALDIRVSTISNDRVQKHEKMPASLKIVFLSRISPMKNLDYALKVVSQLKGNVVFDIYGPINREKDTRYWAQCQRLIKEIPVSVEVNYKGTVEPIMVYDVFSQYDVFLFPTRGENFGHIIVEALSVGCPVVLSDQTPWRNLEDKHAGWDLPLDQPSSFVKVLEQLFAMDNGEYTKFSEGAKKFAMAMMNNKKAVQQNFKLFSSVLSDRAGSHVYNQRWIQPPSATR